MIDQELLPNVAGTYGNNGKLYAIPARFSMPTLWGKPEAMKAASSMEALVKYAEANPDNRLMHFMGLNELFLQFYVASSASWFDGKGKLDESSFASYLEAL